MEETLDFTLFQKFRKIPRLNRDIIVTEKIDGTNAQVYVVDRRLISIQEQISKGDFIIPTTDYFIFAGSRKRWLTKEKDNFGFFKWVEERAEELSKLGPGRHYGEFWGQGIQRKYDLKEKRFSLFNVSIWNEENKPECCHVVPVLYKRHFSQGAIDDCVAELTLTGSVAAPGFMNPEGIIVFHSASNNLYKVTCKNDGVPKCLVKE